MPLPADPETRLGLAAAVHSQWRTVMHAFYLAKGSVTVKSETAGVCAECDEVVCIPGGTYSKHKGGIRFKPSRYVCIKTQRIAGHSRWEVGPP
jgi:hypothetical protein